jgi:hypothetical protein
MSLTNESTIEKSEMAEARERVKKVHKLRTKPKVYHVTWKRLLEAMENIPSNLENEGDDVHGNILTTLRFDCGLDINSEKKFRSTYDRLYGYMMYTLYYKGPSGVKASEVYDQLDMSLFPMRAMPLRFKKETIAKLEKTINDYWYDSEKDEEEDSDDNDY